MAGAILFTGCGEQENAKQENTKQQAETEETETASAETKTTINVGVTAGSYVNYVKSDEDFFEEEFAAGDASAIMVSQDSDIQSIADLAGKKVGAFAGSGGHAFLLKALDEAGLTVDDIEFVNISPVDVMAALENGEVDAAVFTYQFIYAAEQTGEARVLRDSEGLYRFALIYSANKDFLTNYPELAKRFLKVNERMKNYIDENREAAYDTIAEATGVERGVYDRFDFVFSPEFEDADYEEIDSMAAFLYDTGVVENEIDVDSIYDFSYLEDAVSEVENE
jgi:sulfonate transport system substrate-binding protein